MFGVSYSFSSVRPEYVQWDVSRPQTFRAVGVGAIGRLMIRQRTNGRRRSCVKLRIWIMFKCVIIFMVDEHLVVANSGWQPAVTESAPPAQREHYSNFHHYRALVWWLRDCVCESNVWVGVPVCIVEIDVFQRDEHGQWNECDQLVWLEAWSLQIMLRRCVCELWIRMQHIFPALNCAVVIEMDPFSLLNMIRTQHYVYNIFFVWSFQ